MSYESKGSQLLYEVQKNSLGKASFTELSAFLLQLTELILTHSVLVLFFIISCLSFI